MIRTLLSLLLLCLVLVGCGEVRGDRVLTGVSADEPTTDALAFAAPPRSNAIEVRNVEGNEAFSFAATELLTGRSVNGADLVANGPVVMTFLIPQCPVCVVAGPDLAASAAANPEITYVFVHSGGTTDSYRTYLTRSGFDEIGAAGTNVVHLDDSPGLLWARFGVIQQPTNVLIDADGSVTQSLGALGSQELAEVAERLTS